MELVAILLDSAEQESDGVTPVWITIGSEQRIDIPEWGIA